MASIVMRLLGVGRSRVEVTSTECLTDAMILEVMAGKGTMEQIRHLENCPVCQEIKLSIMREVIGMIEW